MKNKPREIIKCKKRKITEIKHCNQISNNEIKRQKLLDDTLRSNTSSNNHNKSNASATIKIEVENLKPPRRYKELSTKDIAELRQKYKNATKDTLPDIPTTTKKQQIIPGTRDKVIIKTLNSNEPIIFIYHYSTNKKQQPCDKYICCKCPKINITSRNMLKHAECHSKSNWICQPCQQIFASKRSLLQHNESFHKQDVICDICRHIFRCKRILKQHYKQQHPNAPFSSNINQTNDPHQSIITLPDKLTMSKMKAIELKNICKKFCLSQQGTREQLQISIIHFIRNQKGDTKPILKNTLKVLFLYFLIANK